VSPTAKIFWSELWYDTWQMLLACSGGIFIIAAVLGFAFLPEVVMAWAIAVVAGIALIISVGYLIHETVGYFRKRWQQAEVKARNRR
jgi:hypothetical protein